jgi:hypothetical protein
MLVGLNLTLGTQLGHPTETVGIDPKQAFPLGPRKGRNAQIPAVPHRLGERVKSTRCRPSRLIPGTEGMRT